MNIVVLCNGPLALPSIDLFIERKLLSGLCVPVVLERFPYEMEELADRHAVPFLMVRPPRVNDALGQWLEAIHADLVLVMLFPYRIDRNVLCIPRHGFFNFHPGLLPKYRGPDPVFWQIRNQERYGGVTLHKMDEHFDSGPIAFVQRVEIDPSDTYEDHSDRLPLAALKATEYLLPHLSGTFKIHLTPQVASQAQYQTYPGEKDQVIDWNRQDAVSVLALTRACSMYGGSIAYLRSAPVYILRASLLLEPNDSVEPGTILQCDPLIVRCLDQSVVIEEFRVADLQLLKPAARFDSLISGEVRR